ncbi:helix-turn-helix transcriptional regulator [Shewanella youngdeokensis]|uniref:HTH luxR-type domain-containing protein n=1 Tax=Shewanella youngdeokensis TaxID=2999068 RepID=A0ABZ0JXA0_9GAMM|nr:hypothetical protein RGE70_14285 [Shewanella sp. DAU334]
MQVSNLLLELSKTYGIKDAFFALDIKSEKFCNHFSKIKRTPSRNNMLSSSVNASKYSIENRRKWASSDPNVYTSLSSSKHHWDYSNWPNGKPSPQDLLVKYGYSNKISIETQCMLNPNWVGRFYFVTEEQGQILEPQFLREINSDLMDIHYMILSSSVNYLNPFMDYKVIKQSDVKILSMIAEGHNRESIAAGCYLTPRGVDYRTLQLKKKLCANNNSSLIKSAYENFLLD